MLRHTMTKRTLVINSHVQSAIPRRHLLDSLEACPQWEDTPIIVVVGGAATHTHLAPQSSHIEHVYVPYNAIDFTSFVALSERAADPTDEFFVIHDTCVVAPHFLDRMHAIRMPGRSCRLSRPSCNMGLYTHALIAEHKDTLATYAATTGENTVATQELKRRCVRDEDLLFDKDPTNTMHGPGVTRVSEPMDYYGTGTMRRIEEYGDLGLSKIKANWYVRQRYVLTP
jgi:hypothetical protein